MTYMIMLLSVISLMSIKTIGVNFTVDITDVYETSSKLSTDIYGATPPQVFRSCMEL